MPQFREIARGLQFPEGPIAMPDGSVLLGPVGTGGPAAVPEAAWARYEALLARAAGPAPELVPSRPAERLSARDHLPVAGALPAPGADRGPAGVAAPVCGGLWVATAFGGRGLLWSVVAAEAIAARLEGEPAPIEPALLRALAPERFLSSPTRRPAHGP